MGVLAGISIIRSDPLTGGPKGWPGILFCALFATAFVRRDNIGPKNTFHLTKLQLLCPKKACLLLLSLSFFMVKL